MNDQRAAKLQARYYRQTAAAYERMHSFDEHRRAIDYVVGHLLALRSRSVLDTGCGTGLVMRQLMRSLPEIEVRGNDRSPELLRQAVERHGIAQEQLDLADSAQLPYGDEAFDAVVASGLMHHVADPDRIVSEMLRVARQAVFISDVNRYGLGPVPLRLLKLCLARAGLWQRLNRLRLGGVDWHYSPGDGVAWSYSVLDSRPLLAAGCQRVIAIPTAPPRRRRPLVPPLQCSHFLLCGFKGSGDTA